MYIFIFLLLLSGLALIFNYKAAVLNERYDEAFDEQSFAEIEQTWYLRQSLDRLSHVNLE